jgi:predicted permease
VIPGLAARVRSLWAGIRRGRDVDAEMQEEFRHHIEQRAADLMRGGMSLDAALRRAQAEFGGTYNFGAEGRESRGLRWYDALRVSWLDFKLGGRMLLKYPGLTIIGGIAIAFAIWVGGGTFELISQGVRPTLPLPQGDRVVALELWNVQTNRREPRLLHDFVAWRSEARTVEDLGVFRAAGRNLTLGRDGLGEPVSVAEISAVGFRVARVAPLLGRGLVDGDESPSAPNVVVIGYKTWQRRFGADPDVVGRTVRVGRDEYAVVGVMPEGFGFPISQQAWVPLRLNALDYAVGEGPVLSGVFGRLADGVSMKEAQAELSAIAARRSASFAQTHEHLRARVGPLAKPMVNTSDIGAVLAWSMNLFLVMLLLLVCGNVALLMFARAASREAEIIVRTALGASRARIVMQFFAEALVLGSLGALVGLSLLDFGLRWVLNGGVFGNPDFMPFWIRDQVSPLTVLYIVVLTVIGAVVAGVVPAFKVTRGLADRLKTIGAGGGGLKFGGVWTAIIVTQVALTLGFPAITYYTFADTEQIRSTNIGVPTREYLTAQIFLDRNPSLGVTAVSQDTLNARFDAARRELTRRLMADGAVTSVTFAQRLPLMYHPASLVELDEGPAAPRNPQWPNGYRISDAAVDLNFFETFDAPARDGRLFHQADFGPAEGHRPVIVNEAFVRLVMRGRSPVGRRLRYVWRETDKSDTEPGPWHEIVGVVKNMGNAVGASVGEVEGGHDPKKAGIYHPLKHGTVSGAYVAMRLAPGVDVSSYGQKLRAHADAADQSLQIQKLMSLDLMTASELSFYAFWITILLLVSGIAMLLSLAGIYAVMSFTVTRRTREIGIRVALGASPTAVLLAVLRRPIIQLSLGIGVGVLLVSALSGLIEGFRLQWDLAGWIVLYAAFMTSLCMLACVLPIRRALRVQPTDALRTDV